MDIQDKIEKTKDKKMNTKFDNIERKKLSNSSFKFNPKARPIWEIATEISAQIPDSEWEKVPMDLAKNFDKYQTETITENNE